MLNPYVHAPVHSHFKQILLKTFCAICHLLSLYELHRENGWLDITFDIHQRVPFPLMLSETCHMPLFQVICVGLKKALKNKTAKFINNEERLCHAKRKMHERKEVRNH